MFILWDHLDFCKISIYGRAFNCFENISIFEQNVGIIYRKRIYRKRISVEISSRDSNSLAVNSKRSSLHQFESSAFFAKALKLFYNCQKINTNFVTEMILTKNFKLQNRISVYVEPQFRSNLGVEPRGRTSGSNVGVERRGRTSGSNLGLGRTSGSDLGGSNLGWSNLRVEPEFQKKSKILGVLGESGIFFTKFDLLNNFCTANLISF